MKKSVSGAYMAQVKDSFLFGGLAPDAVEQYILPHARACEFAKQETIFTPQSKADRLGVILAGTVHILSLFSDGRYSLMNSLSAPKTLGADLIGTKSRQPPYYAVCAVQTKVLFFPGKLFTDRGLLPEPYRTEILSRLLTLVSQENMQKYYRLAIISQKGLRERVLTYLTMQTQKRGTNTFEIPFSREELAAFLCVNRSALSHELSLMKQAGLIDFHRNAFTLLPLGEARSLWWANER